VTGPAVAVSGSAGHTVSGTAEQMELISTDPRVMHGQAELAGARVPMSVILDCLAAGMTAEEILAEYPAMTRAGIRTAAVYGRRWRVRNCCRYRTSGEVQAR
jgi:uncharacterized protein (DUF433 family)